MPFRVSNRTRISEIVWVAASKNYHCRTCFQRRRPKPNSPPAPRRWRNKPMSMMTSNTKSTMNEAKIVGFVASMLITVQPAELCDQLERTYGCLVSLVGLKQLRQKTHPCDTCDITRFTRNSPVIFRRYLPLIWNPMSVNHVAIAIPIINLFLFQMATLPGFDKRNASGG
jgi:hypothetical protein